MDIVLAKCPNCAAPLKVDKSNNEAICDYCGTSFILEEPTNNINETNNLNESTTNNYYNSKEKLEKLIKGAEALERNGKNALDEWKEIIHLYPEDYRGWMNMIKYCFNYNDVIEFYDKSLALSEAEKSQELVKRTFYDSLQLFLRNDNNEIAHRCLIEYYENDIKSWHQTALEYVESYKNKKELDLLKRAFLHAIVDKYKITKKKDTTLIQIGDEFAQELLPFVFEDHFYWKGNDYLYPSRGNNIVLSLKISDIETSILACQEEDRSNKIKKEQTIKKIKKFSIEAAVILTLFILTIEFIIPNYYYSKANDLLIDKNYENAIVYYEKAGNFKNSEEQKQMAERRLEEQEIREQARQLYLLVIERFKNGNVGEDTLSLLKRLEWLNVYEGVWYYLGEYYYQNGIYDEAVAEWNKLKSKENYPNLTIKMENAKQYAIYLEALELADRNHIEEAYNELCNLKKEVEDSESLKSIFKDAMDTGLLGEWKLVESSVDTNPDMDKYNYIAAGYKEGEIRFYSSRFSADKGEAVPSMSILDKDVELRYYIFQEGKLIEISPYAGKQTIFLDGDRLRIETAEEHHENYDHEATYEVYERIQ